ncbi:serine acetyltransferase [Clostridium perfringens]|uniref:serine acetyltransferase n=1 Tax=Clostridium perfringens TaxID=1502 RepID=UPI001A1C915F|nr:serine acetyltransferase [Clostridium perfringens]HAT4122594.1 serine acetyltransferase [Clostridium perfringens]
MNINTNNWLIKQVMGIVQHYNHEKYWNRRDKVVNPNCTLPKIIKYYYLFYIKRCDAFNNASFGTDLNRGALFKSHPNLPHHLNGIIISHYAEIGVNCTIHQQVTIGQSTNNKAAKIGDNVMIGAGAKIIGDVTIGNNVKIGANCIVIEDIPDNSTVVLSKPRVIVK